MNFKSWFILSEELYLQNNTATIFHRTKSFEKVQQMMNGGFTAGGGAFHGPGLYTTYTLKGTTNLGYGPYVVKLKVNNLKNYFVLEPDIAQQIHGDKWKLKDQAKILKLKLKLTAKQWQKYQEISESGDFGSAAASKALKDDGHFLWEHGCKGIIYNGAQDGKCICVYAPYEDLQFLAYAYAPAPTTVDFIEKNWVKSGKGVSIRSISDLKFPEDTGIGSTSVKKQYELENPEKVIPIDISEILNDVSKGKYVKLKFYLSRNKLSDDDVIGLIGNAPDKDQMINFIIKNKTELSGQNVFDLLVYTSDIEKMAEILGPDNINKLTSNNVIYFLKDASDIEEMARILGPDNMSKLSGYNVYVLFKSTGVGDGQMARILGQENINKLNGENVYYLLHGASDKDQMARILGSDNINKLIGGHVSDLLSRVNDKEEMRQILRKYYTGTNPEVISILNQ
jgi:hypothetical protein